MALSELSQEIQELVSNSWYDYSAGKKTPLHPYDGETTPNYTGPQAPYDHLDVDNAAYSWVKSPRWRGQAMEVGPLAHVLMLYASGHEATQDAVNTVLGELKLPLKALYSTLGRTAARTLEAKILADEMQGWYQQLQDNIVAGDLRTHNNVIFNTTGTFTVSFTVTDSLGMTDPTPASRSITVNDPNPACTDDDDDDDDDEDHR